MSKPDKSQVDVKAFDAWASREILRRLPNVERARFIERLTPEQIRHLQED